MDNSKEFQLMLYEAIKSEPSVFEGFDKTKNVQDQLQEKVIPEDERDSTNKYVVLLDDFQDWVLNDCTGLEWSHKGCPSMEQLWLAFVMFELYHKHWTGEDWVLND